MAFGDTKRGNRPLVGMGFGSTRTKIDLSSLIGLQQAAGTFGLEEEARRALATKGEETKQIFGGGLITDIFDVLNALQYGIVGVLKGKGFSEGVRTRQSFSDKDALGDHGIPGIIGGIALDIAVDPLTYIAPWTIFKKIPGAVKAVKAISKTAEASNLGKWFSRKFVWMGGVDPIFRKTYERSIKNTAVGANNIAEMVKGITKISPDVARKLLTRDKTGRFIRTPLEKLRGVLTQDELFNVSKTYAVLDDLGKQAVESGLLKKGTWQQNVGEYIKNAYLEYEQKTGKGKGMLSFMQFGIKGIKPRKPGLTAEKMVELGQIDNPAYLLFKSMIDLHKDVENVKLFRLVAQKLASKTAKEGFQQLPTGKRLGDLASKYVPQNIYDYIQEIAQPITYGVGKKIVANFKFFKVIMNPATHARNIVSNKVLNWWKIGMNPLDPRVWETDLVAVREIFKGTGKWIKEATPEGYNLNTMVSHEIMSILDGPEALAAGKQIGKGWGAIRRKLGDIYQGEENWAKLSAFIYNRKHKGMGKTAAWLSAEAATFNYAQVTPFIRTLRESLFGYPFITFTYKATPIAIETALKHPVRISSFGKIKNAIENMSDIEETARERAAEPQWIRDGFYIKLPVKDKHGRSAYFDLTYIIPFGDIVSGQYFTRQVQRETGLQESFIETAMEKLPLWNLVKQISRNEDFYGDKIWRTTDSSNMQLGDLMRHLSKAYLPPLVADQLPGGYMRSGERRFKGIVGALKPKEDIKQQRTLMQEMLRNMGIKIQPIDVDIQETYMEWEKKKALETILMEKGPLKEFRKLYVPR